MSHWEGKDWVRVQYEVIYDTIKWFPLDFRCVDWATMRLALRFAVAKRPELQWDRDYKFYKKRADAKDKFTLEELRRALP